MQLVWSYHPDSSMYMPIESGIFDRPAAENYLYDGVTTVITGKWSSADDVAVFFPSIRLNAYGNQRSFISRS